MPEILDQELGELPVSNKIALRVYWSFFWRSPVAWLVTLIVSFILALVIGIGLFIVAKILHIDDTLIRLLLSVFSFCLGSVLHLIVGFFVFKMMLSIRYDDFRIALLPRDRWP